MKALKKIEALKNEVQSSKRWLRVLKKIRDFRVNESVNDIQDGYLMNELRLESWMDGWKWDEKYKRT